MLINNFNSYLKSVFISLLLLGNSLYSSEKYSILDTSLERAKISFSSNNGNIQPDIFIPIYWNESFFSGLGYSSSYENTHKPLTQINGRISKAVYENSALLNVLSYQYRGDLTYTIGVNANYLDIKFDEFGYYESEEKTVAFNNSATNTVISASIYADITVYKISNLLSARVGASITPYSSLKNEQKLYLASSTESHSVEGEYTQDTSYELYMDVQLSLPWSIDIALQGYYSYLPLKFESIQFNPSTLKTEIQTLETKEIEYGGDVKLLFSKFSLMGMKPSIGFRYENSSLEKNSESLYNNQSNNFLLFGFEKIF